MNKEKLLETWKKELNSIYEEKEIENIFQLVFATPFVKGGLGDFKALKEILERLKTKEPIQYILGSTLFYDLELEVNKNTLIPRPETEELVDLIIKENKDEEVKVLDIGTGSGCIILALASKLKGDFFGLDKNKEALKVAKKNAEKNNLNISFLEDSILETKLEYKVYDIIVSNPPYIPRKELGEVEKNVLEQESDSALFVEDEDPIIFYKAIFDFCQNHLSKSGKLYFEINPNYKNEIIDYIKNREGWNYEVFQDMQGKDRIMRVWRVI